MTSGTGDRASSADRRPLLTAHELRLDMDGATALEQVTFETRGRSVALVGDGYAVLAALAGAASIRRGGLSLFDFDVSRGEHFAAVGLAPLDPPLVPSWNVTEFLTWSARLAGLRRRAAVEAARRTLSELGLAALGRAVLSTLPVAERRAVVLAQAVVASPAVLVAAAPLAGLAEPAASYVGRVLLLAQRDRSSILGLSGLFPGSPEHGVAANAEDVLVFSAGRLVRQGRLPALEQGASGYIVTVRSRVAELQAALAPRGVTWTGGPARFWVDLPDAVTETDLLATAMEVGAPIVELSPRLPTRRPEVLKDESGPP